MELSPGAQDVLVSMHNGVQLVRETDPLLGPVYRLGDRDVTPMVTELLIARLVDNGEGVPSKGERRPCKLTPAGEAEAERIKRERSGQ